MAGTFELPPIVHIGGQQPYCPALLSPAITAVPVNSPIPDAAAAIVAENILDAWNAPVDATIWLQRAPFLIQTGRPGDFVISRPRWLDATLAAWIDVPTPLPQVTPPLPVSVTAVPVNNPLPDNPNIFFPILVP